MTFRAPSLPATILLHLEKNLRLTSAWNNCRAHVTVALFIIVGEEHPTWLGTCNTQGSKPIVPEPSCQALPRSSQSHLRFHFRLDAQKCCKTDSCSDQSARSLRSVVSLSGERRSCSDRTKSMVKSGKWKHWKIRERNNEYTHKCLSTLTD